MFKCSLMSLKTGLVKAYLQFIQYVTSESKVLGRAQADNSIQ